MCPGGRAKGYTYFIPQEEHLESRIITRAYMEAKLTVSLAGRSAPYPLHRCIAAFGELQYSTVPLHHSVLLASCRLSRSPPHNQVVPVSAVITELRMLKGALLPQERGTVAAG